MTLIEVFFRFVTSIQFVIIRVEASAVAGTTTSNRHENLINLSRRSRKAQILLSQVIQGILPYPQKSPVAPNLETDMTRAPPF